MDGMTILVIRALPYDHSHPPYNTLGATRETTVRELDALKAKARALARSGYFCGLPPLEFELSFEKGFKEERMAKAALD